MEGIAQHGGEKVAERQKKKATKLRGVKKGSVSPARMPAKR